MPDYQQLIASECDTLKALLLAKNADYGNAAFEPIRVFSNADPIEQIRVRIDDKLNRIRNRGEKAITEDTVMDLIGYLVLLRVAELAEHIDEDDSSDSKACWNDRHWWQKMASIHDFNVAYGGDLDTDWYVEVRYNTDDSAKLKRFWSIEHQDPWNAAYQFVMNEFIKD